MLPFRTTNSAQKYQVVGAGSRTTSHGQRQRWLRKTFGLNSNNKKVTLPSQTDVQSTPPPPVFDQPIRPTPVGATTQQKIHHSLKHLIMHNYAFLNPM